MWSEFFLPGKFHLEGKSVASGTAGHFVLLPYSLSEMIKSLTWVFIS